ncbi:hypothetical protein ACFY0R_20895 [Streptomyces sp. NPDC001633]|uniref:hypothetical protein n=1 Tax=Streptomyces sp. NPDC001633 TaxID=3364595 RepID=UPI003681CC65
MATALLELGADPVADPIGGACCTTWVTCLIRAAEARGTAGLCARPGRLRGTGRRPLLDRNGVEWVVHDRTLTTGVEENLLESAECVLLRSQADAPLFHRHDEVFNHG